MYSIITAISGLVLIAIYIAGVYSLMCDEISNDFEYMYEYRFVIEVDITNIV